MAGADAMTVSLLTIPEIERGPLHMRPRLLCATWQGVPVLLTRSPYVLTYTLARQPGWVLSHDELLDAVHGAASTCYSDRSIDSLVKLVRRSFRLVDPSFQCLETVSGVGYRWAAT